MEYQNLKVSIKSKFFVVFGRKITIKISTKDLSLRFILNHTYLIKNPRDPSFQLFISFLLKSCLTFLKFFFPISVFCLLFFFSLWRFYVMFYSFFIFPLKIIFLFFIFALIITFPITKRVCFTIRILLYICFC